MANNVRKEKNAPEDRLEFNNCSIAMTSNLTDQRQRLIVSGQVWKAIKPQLIKKGNFDTLKLTEKSQLEDHFEENICGRY